MYVCINVLLNLNSLYFLFFFIASKQVYRPPQARNLDFKPTSLHEESSETSITLFIILLGFLIFVKARNSNYLLKIMGPQKILNDN